MDILAKRRRMGEYPVKLSTVTAQFPCDCKTVWDIVTDNKSYEWRSDLSKIEIIDENRFDEYTRNGFVTHFRITAKEPYREWRFIHSKRWIAVLLCLFLIVALAS